MRSSILPFAVVLFILALALTVVFWNKYFNLTSTTTKWHTLSTVSLPVRNCKTSCCKEHNFAAVTKHFANDSHSPIRCYMKIGFHHFGDHEFSFQSTTSEPDFCEGVFRLGRRDASCHRSYYNLSRRALECAQTSECTSPLSKCLHHICAQGVIEYKEDVSGKRKHRRSGSDVLSEIHRVPGSRDLLASIMAKGNVNSSVSTKEFLTNVLQRVYEQQKEGFPETVDYSLRSLLAASWIACGMSSSAAIPFFEDLSPLTQSIQRWRKLPPSLDLSEKPHDKLVVATFATSYDQGLDVLIESAALVSIELVVLGYGEVNVGKASKLPRMLEFLRTLHNETVVLFLDGYDTMLVKGEEYILSAYQSLQKDILFAAEGCCYPYLYHQFNMGVDLCDLYYPKIQNDSKNLRFLNSGTYIGYASALTSLLSDLESLVGLEYAESYPGADQTPMGQMLMSGRWNIGLDYQGKIFIDCIAYSDEEVKRAEAAVLHFQGQKARGIGLASDYFLPRMCLHHQNLADKMFK